MPRSAPRTLLCGAVATLCACAGGGPAERPAVEPPPRLLARVYDCDGTRAVVEQLSSDEIQLRLPSRRVRLPRVGSSSGAKYALADTVFWSKGPIALLELPEASSAQCEEDRPSSLREDARLRGVHYRGLGSEPGFSIEIGPEDIAFEYDYGAKKLVFPLEEPRVEDDGQRTYDQTTSSHRLRVAIEDGICLDSMTGDAFDTSVEVTLDGRTFRGCGDALR
jgi:putative lipoprotein